MRMHDPLARLLLLGALIASLLTAIAIALAHAVHHPGQGAAAPPHERR